MLFWLDVWSQQAGVNYRRRKLASQALVNTICTDNAGGLHVVRNLIGIGSTNKWPYACSGGTWLVDNGRRAYFFSSEVYQLVTCRDFWPIISPNCGAVFPTYKHLLRLSRWSPNGQVKSEAFGCWLFRGRNVLLLALASAAWSCPNPFNGMLLHCVIASITWFNCRCSEIKGDQSSSFINYLCCGV
jgi:hypothetical protein